ncbi:MAG: hypothetical protein QGH47_00355, partial [Candidatus Woesearchaeota archaeon]|nr:hypothetical protein [Candidatus Woesearchaeota archaeon]
TIGGSGAFVLLTAGLFFLPHAKARGRKNKSQSDQKQPEIDTMKLSVLSIDKVFKKSKQFFY